MAKSYDIEQLLVDIKTFLISNLGPKLSAIDAEKNDDITLVQPNANAYYVQSLDNAPINFGVVVFFGVSDFPETESLGPASAQKLQLLVSIIICDGNNDLNLYRRLFRYQRALKEIFEKNWTSVGGNLRFKVSRSTPETIKVDESRTDHLTGILLETVLP